MTELPWWCDIDIRIVHSDLDPRALTEIFRVVPSVSQLPGESKVPFGACKSAGYWCLTHRVNHPERPDSAIIWAEQFMHKNEMEFRKLIEKEANINIYLGIHSNVMTIGFVLPATPTISKLELQLGIEFYS